MGLFGKKISFSLLAAVFGAMLFAGLCLVLHTAPDRLIGAAFCHQLPSRSPSHGFPFCFRCSGLFSGVFWGILFSLSAKPSEKRFEKKLPAAFIAAFILFLIDIVNTTEYIPLHWYEERENIRFLSSFPLGYMLVRIMSAVWHILFDIRRQKKDSSPFISPLFMLITAAFSYLIIFRGTPFILHCFGYLLACGSLFLLLALYSILVKCIALLKNRTCRDRAALETAIFFVFLHLCILGGIHIRFIPFELLESIQ